MQDDIREAKLAEFLDAFEGQWRRRQFHETPSSSYRSSAASSPSTEELLTSERDYMRASFIDAAAARQICALKIGRF